LFDGTLNSIPVPDGANLNDVLLLLETFVIQSIDELNLEYVLSAENCLGLPAGTYGYNQIFDAVNAAICSIEGDITTIQGDITTIENDITAIEGDITSIEGDITTIQTDITNIETNITESMPLGSMIVFPSATPPNAKWLRCEGQPLSTTIYADLFAVIGYSFGGAGLSFNLPDLRGQFIAGYNAGGAAEYQTVGQGGGQNPGNHDHKGGETFNTILEGGTLQPGDQMWDLDEGGAVGPNLYRTNEFPYADGAHTHTGVTGDGTSDGLAGQAHENRPEFLAFPWMIKVVN